MVHPRIFPAHPVPPLLCPTYSPVVTDPLTLLGIKEPSRSRSGTFTQNLLLEPKDTMRLLSQTLCLCLALALCQADHHAGHTNDVKPGGHNDHQHGQNDHQHGQNDHGHHTGFGLDRCKGLEMDAVVVNEEGVPYFFKGDHLFKGFHGKAELSNGSFAELDDHHHLGHVDAAFRMHYEDNPTEHDHIFFFLDTKVFSYYKHKLEDGYPKDISAVFPGIPDHLTAAVVCPKPDCDEDSVIFFKGDDIYHYNVRTKKVDEKEFKSMPNCTSAFRYAEHYYCFHGHQFSKFDPKTGDVHGRYPKEARDYFMKCSKFGNTTDHVEREQCSRVHLDAITSDDAGNVLAFRGHYFLDQDAATEKWTADPIEKHFKELHSNPDAVFTYENHLYMVKDNKIYVYTTAEPHKLLEGYPKALKDEIGLEGPISAAFVCQDHHIAHVVKGQTIYDIDLKASPRVPVKDLPFTTVSSIDAGMCGPKGVKIFKGNYYYHFDSMKVMLMSKLIPEAHSVPMELFGCDH
ncbi:hemopexin [Esox lucius]|uniref:Hemopexin n=1 Tax=Esox lucius TaxID=8010 RepID=A0A3P8YF29_ESOLU|nr:hemopexin [Esox lucius]